MAVLDAPVDYEHAQISAVLDEELLQKLKFVDEHGSEKTWYELNNEILDELKKRINEGRYQEQADFVDSVSALTGGKLSANGSSPQAKIRIFDSVLKGFFKYLTSKRWRTEVDIVGSYLHGTHVAGLAVKSLTNIRLITFPIVGAPKQVTASQIWKFDAEAERTERRTYLKQISEALQSNNVRVVNLSIATSDDIALKIIKKNSSLWTKLLTLGKKRKVAHEKAKIYKEELERFFGENPRTVFVLGAGNEKTDLDIFAANGKVHTAMIKAPNLVKVGSTDAKGDISKFSNRSQNYVDIAANGEGVLSSKVGGGEIHMSGTSMATPIVANRIAEIIAANPSASAEETIEKLFQEHAIQGATLSHLIAGSKVLGGVRPEKAISLAGLSEEEIRGVVATEIDQFVISDLRSQKTHITKNDGSKMTLVPSGNLSGKVDVQIVKGALDVGNP